MCARKVTMFVSYPLHQTEDLPFCTTAPISPLVDRFILSKAISRSRSVRKVVDSGRFGSKNRVKTPIKTAGMP